jgi:glucokinase
VSTRDATAIGIDVGGTQIRAAEISAAGEVLAWTAQPTPPDPREAIARIRGLVQQLDGRDVAAIGIGVPGRVDTCNGRILSGGYVDLSGHSLAGEIGNRTGRPVIVDNDGNLALYGEHATGSARAAGTVVMFTIGTGIGGAVIAQGKLLRGRRAAGQLGHIAIDRNGELCLCGRRGCVETMSSGTALGRHIAAAGLPADISVDGLLQRAGGGDDIARRVLAAWAAPMRMAIDTVVAAFDPDLVVLGGGLGAAMHRALDRFPAEARWYQCTVVPAALGDRAGVIGAGLSALSRIEQPARAQR